MWRGSGDRSRTEGRRAGDRGESPEGGDWGGERGRKGRVGSMEASPTWTPRVRRESWGQDRNESREEGRRESREEGRRESRGEGRRESWGESRRESLEGGRRKSWGESRRESWEESRRESWAEIRREPCGENRRESWVESRRGDREEYTGREGEWRKEKVGSHITCFNCQDFGHKAWECTKPHVPRGSHQGVGRFRVGGMEMRRGGMERINYAREKREDITEGEKRRMEEREFTIYQREGRGCGEKGHPGEDERVLRRMSKTSRVERGPGEERRTYPAMVDIGEASRGHLSEGKARSRSRGREKVAAPRAKWMRMEKGRERTVARSSVERGEERNDSQGKSKEHKRMLVKESYKNKSRAELVKELEELERRKKKKKVKPQVRQVKIGNQELIKKLDLQFENMQKNKSIEDSPETQALGNKRKRESSSTSSSSSSSEEEGSSSSTSSEDESRKKVKVIDKSIVKSSSEETSDEDTSKSTKEDESSNQSKDDAPQLQDPDSIISTNVYEENQAVMEETMKMLDNTDKIFNVKKNTLEEDQNKKEVMRTVTQDDDVKKKETLEDDNGKKEELEDIVENKKKLDQEVEQIEESILTTMVGLAFYFDCLTRRFRDDSNLFGLVRVFQLYSWLLRVIMVTFDHHYSVHWSGWSLVVSVGH